MKIANDELMIRMGNRVLPLSEVIDVLSSSKHYLGFGFPCGCNVKYFICNERGEHNGNRYDGVIKAKTIRGHTSTGNHAENSIRNVSVENGDPIIKPGNEDSR